VKAKRIKPVKHVVVRNENAHTHVSNSNVRGGEMSTSEINVSELERDLRKLYDQYDYQGDFYGHFGQGCVHTRIDFDMESAAGIKKFRSFIYDAANLVIKYGGSLSGEHGDGQARAELLPMMYGDELVEAFRKFKSIKKG